MAEAGTIESPATGLAGRVVLSAEVGEWQAHKSHDVAARGSLRILH